MTKPPARSRRGTSRPDKSNARRAKQAAQRPPRRRRRLIGWAAVVAAVAVVAVVFVAMGLGRHSTEVIGVGARAPDGNFTTVSGGTRTVAGLRGHPTLLWFVATWCSSCQAGTKSMASHIDDFVSRGVRVVELDVAAALGQPGPSIADFGAQLAGDAYTNPDWIWGEASSDLTTTYDPGSYLDIYYLLDSAGRIVYVGSSPGSTMGQLLAHAAAVGAST